MMKSLWSGVSGLQAHQVAMDVEGHNIANVNTIGFKYSRANFSEMLSQTYKPATAPQGGLGGKNDMQVGLGTSVASTTRIYSQGSTQNTDKATDMALQGDGFFIVSPDGGITYNYTRAGDFNFDSQGNLVDANGLVAQGWIRKISSEGEGCSGSDAGTVDSTQPIQNIQIEPGLKIPAKTSTYVSLRANLDNGNIVETKSCIYALDSNAGTKTPTGTSARYKDTSGKILDYGEDDFGILFNANGSAFNLQSIDSTGGNGQGFVYSIQTDSVNIYKYNMRYTNGKFFSASDSNTQMSLTSSQDTTTGITTHNVKTNGGQDILFRTTEDLRKMLQTLIRDPNGDTGNNSGLTHSSRSTTTLLNGTANATNVSTIDALATDIPTSLTVSINGGTPVEVFDDVIDDGAGGGLIGALQTAINADLTAPDSVTVSYVGGQIVVTRNGASTGEFTIALASDSPTFETIVSNLNGIYGPYSGVDAKVTVDSSGRFAVTNNEPTKNVIIGVTELTDATTTSNVLFTQAFQSLDGITLAKNTRYSQNINAATHASSIDVFDSFGTKHSLRMEFRKTGINEWSWTANVPEPSTLIGQDGLSKQLEGGLIKFNKDGSLQSYSPPTLTFEPNNGSKGAQIIQMQFGTTNAFDGLTSLDATSSTSGISQDGYAGGDLLGLRVDQTGSIIGSFSNGRSVALAQVAIAKFTNASGLSSNGSNLFTQTANSGEPILGTPGTGGRGSIQASSLEMSNVDLSRSLTQLIVVQRGYQANSKTITTSDQMLQALLALKQ